MSDSDFQAEIDRVEGQSAPDADRNRESYTEHYDNNSDPGDVCNSYSWSIMYCFILTLAIIAWLLVMVLILKSRVGALTCMDRIMMFLFLLTIIQFGPMLASSLHIGHNVYNYSQTSCKLMYYTEYGSRHVITATVLGLIAYAYFGLRHGFESVDRKAGATLIGSDQSHSSGRMATSP